MNVEEHLQLGMFRCRVSALYQTELQVLGYSIKWPLKIVFQPVTVPVTVQFKSFLNLSLLKTGYVD